MHPREKFCKAITNAIPDATVEENQGSIVVRFLIESVGERTIHCNKGHVDLHPETMVRRFLNAYKTVDWSRNAEHAFLGQPLDNDP